MRPPTTKAQRKNWYRDSAGVIVTCREQETGRLNTIHAHGPSGEALEDICTQLDNDDGDWRIICVSTPRTIMADLTKRRDDGIRRVDRSRSPEVIALSLIGRMDLLEDRQHRTTLEPRRKTA